MGDESEEREIYPRRRDNKIFGSIWVASNSKYTTPPMWMWAAPAFMLLLMVLGCFGLQFLGWDGTPQVGP